MFDLKNLVTCYTRLSRVYLIYEKRNLILNGYFKFRLGYINDSFYIFIIIIHNHSKLGVTIVQ